MDRVLTQRGSNCACAEGDKKEELADHCGSRECVERVGVEVETEESMSV
jgi:hypothetical protein